LVKGTTDVSASGARRRFKMLLAYGALVTLTIIYIAPLLWMLSTSFKSAADSTRWPLEWVPTDIVIDGYRTIFKSGSESPVLRWFLNSMLAATLHAALVIAITAPAAYALARMDFRGRRIIFAMIVGTIFIPPVIFLMPNYLIVDSLGWIDSLAAIIFPYAAGAFGVFFMRQFFLAFPRELEEAALVDGANRFQVFIRIVLPLSKPALATLAVLSFLNNWNDFLWPLYVLTSPENLTLPPGLSTLQGAYETDYPVIMAGGVVASIPVLLIFVVAQKYVVQGVARTGLKG
jgi:multiple sugar transport system permease protein